VIEKSHMSCCTCHISHVIFVGCSKNRALAWGGGGNQGGGWGRGGGRRQGLIFPLRMRSAGIYIYIYIYGHDFFTECIKRVLHNF
jgi:hypothetical protein